MSDVCVVGGNNIYLALLLLWFRLLWQVGLTVPVVSQVNRGIACLTHSVLGEAQ